MTEESKLLENIDLSNMSNLREVRLVVERAKDGKWKVEFTNLWLPKDIHQAQRAVSNQYRIYRLELVRNLKRSRAKSEEKKEGTPEEATPEIPTKTESAGGTGVSSAIKSSKGVVSLPANKIPFKGKEALNAR